MNQPRAGLGSVNFMMGKDHAPDHWIAVVACQPHGFAPHAGARIPQGCRCFMDGAGAHEQGQYVHDRKRFLNLTNSPDGLLAG